MDLQTILKNYTVNAAELVERHIEWMAVNERTGEAEAVKAKIFLVKNLSVASFERIYSSATIKDKGQWPVLISEHCRFSEDGSEKMSLADAERLSPALGYALVEAIVGAAKEAKDKKKH